VLVVAPEEADEGGREEKSVKSSGIDIAAYLPGSIFDDGKKGLKEGKRSRHHRCADCCHVFDRFVVASQCSVRTPR
jgi:hypothetical protein